MATDSLPGATVRDLVFLVQDRCCDADAAEAQLLASYGMLIKVAAKQYPMLPEAERVAREAFRRAIRDFRFTCRSSITSYCWETMRSALEEAGAARHAPVQLPLLVEPVSVLPASFDLALVRRIYASDKKSKRSQSGSKSASFGLSA